MKHLVKAVVLGFFVCSEEGRDAIGLLCMLQDFIKGYKLSNMNEIISRLQSILSDQISLQHQYQSIAVMNFWLRTQSTRNLKLRQTFLNSSATSLRSPLPIIPEREHEPQNQKYQENRSMSRSNISVSMSGRSSVSGMNWGIGKERRKGNRGIEGREGNEGRIGGIVAGYRSQAEDNGSVQYRNVASSSSESSGQYPKSRVVSSFVLKNSLRNLNQGSDSEDERGDDRGQSRELFRDRGNEYELGSESGEEYSMVSIGKSEAGSKNKSLIKQQAQKLNPQLSNKILSKQPLSFNIFSRSMIRPLSSTHLSSSDPPNPSSSSNPSHPTDPNRQVLFSTRAAPLHSHQTNSKRLLTTNRRHDRRQYIISLIEYCSNQVGLACYNLSTGQIKLTQVIERMTYIQTVSTVERFYPQEIIFSCTLENTVLIRKLMGIFRRTSFRPVKRNLFDETKGYYIYTLRGNKNQHNPDHKFLSYAALNALLLTMESTFEFTVTYQALNIKWHYLQEVLIIDSQTVGDLQLFINKETKIIRNTFIDNFKCLTNGGTRMLRANILQPLTSIVEIQQRQSLLEFLLRQGNKAVLDMLIKELDKFRNYEPITAKFVQSPKSESIKSLKSYLNAILLLSRMCFQLCNLEKKVKSIVQLNAYAKQITIFKKLSQKLEDKRLQSIRKIIEEHFDAQILKSYEDANFHTNVNSKRTRPTAHYKAKTKRDNFIFLFKLQKIPDQFAEISRLTYSHTIEDILKIFQQIKSKSTPQSNLRLLYNEHRGYYISAKTSIDLPYLSTLIQDDIIQINTKSSIVTFSTSILISLNNRLRENENKLIYQSAELLLEVIREIQKNMQILFEVNYWMSMLDMVIGFTTFVKGYQNTFNVNFTRPVFLNSCDNTQPILEIEKLRTIWTMQKFNKLSTDLNLTISSEQSALVIHKQLNSFDQLNILYSLGFLTILAQIGCLVPCMRFHTHIYHTIISKMSMQSNLENKMSHFQLELNNLKNILDYLSERQGDGSRNRKCLILVDELLTGTQPEEEHALSLAAMEEIFGEEGGDGGSLSSRSNCNIGVILVSHRVLFDRLGRFGRVSLCRFEDATGQGQRDVDKEIIQCFRGYNFYPGFEDIYLKIQPSN